MDDKKGLESGSISQRFWQLYLPVTIYGLTLLVGICVYIATPTRSVAVHYETAANHWIQGQPLYTESMESGHGFLYLPHAAILHVPYAYINKLTGSQVIGDVCWRMFSWIVFAIASWRLTRVVAQRSDVAQWRVAIIASLLGISCLRIGQSTLLMAALMMLCIESWQARRFSLASLFVVVAIAVKPLALVLALLLVAVSPAMRLKLAFGVIAFAALPFLMQSPIFVLQQYSDCLLMLGRASEVGNNFEWAQLFGMMHVFGYSADPMFQKVVRMVAALGVLGLVFWSTQTLSRDRQALWLWTFCALYLMLFNPRTENSTYCIIGPVFGVFVSQFLMGHPNVRWHKHILAIGFVVASILTAGSYEIGKYMTPEGFESVWLAPLCTCVFAFCTTMLFVVESRSTSNATTENVSQKSEVDVAF